MRYRILQCSMMRILVLLQKTSLTVWDHQVLLWFRDKCEVFNGVQPTTSEQITNIILCTSNKRQTQQTKIFGPEKARSIGGCIALPTKFVLINVLEIKKYWIVASKSRALNSPSVSWLKLVVVLSLLLACPVFCAIFPAMVEEAGQQFQCLPLQE